MALLPKVNNGKCFATREFIGGSIGLQLLRTDVRLSLTRHTLNDTLGEQSVKKKSIPWSSPNYPTTNKRVFSYFAKNGTKK